MASIESRQSATLVVTVIFLVISSVFVALRFVSRVGIVKRVQLDDYFMLAAWIVSLGLSISICYGTTVGLGRHQVDVPPEWDSALKKTEVRVSPRLNSLEGFLDHALALFGLHNPSSTAIWLSIRSLCFARLLLHFITLNMPLCQDEANSLWLS
jgi:hypothetical protein